MAFDEEIKKIKGYIKKAFRPHPTTDDTTPFSAEQARVKLKKRGSKIDEEVKKATGSY